MPVSVLWSNSLAAVQACQKPSVGADLGLELTAVREYRLGTFSMTRAIRSRPEVLYQNRRIDVYASVKASAL
jgi:hypothetical protein